MRRADECPLSDGRVSARRTLVAAASARALELLGGEHLPGAFEHWINGAHCPRKSPASGVAHSLPGGTHTPTRRPGCTPLAHAGRAADSNCHAWRTRLKAAHSPWSSCLALPVYASAILDISLRGRALRLSPSAWHSLCAAARSPAASPALRRAHLPPRPPAPRPRPPRARSFAACPRSVRSLPSRRKARSPRRRASRARVSSSAR